jgi:hypothetical protein
MKRLFARQLAQRFRRLAVTFRTAERVSLVLIVSILAWASPRSHLAAKDDDSPKRLSRQVRVGETEIGVAITEKPGARFAYVNLHDDENTSVEAVQDVLNRSGGRLVELRHSGRRFVEFKLAGTDYRVDPNRIFTTTGARATLERQSRYSDEAARAVARFAGELLTIYRLDQVDAVIALHNNTPDMYSARSYAAGGIHAHDAEDVFIRDGSDPDDFFFVTERAVFDALKRRGYNVVLQDNRRVTDDGSLSVYCGKANVRYVNVEAELGHLKEQTQMILELTSILNELGPLKRRQGP